MTPTVKFTLFPDQQNHYSAINGAWGSQKAVLAVAGTGSGKTVIGTQAIQDHLKDATGKVLAVAHTFELLLNFSETLAKRGIKHSVLISCPKKLAAIQRNNIKVTGNDWFASAPIRSKVFVSSIQTANARKTDPNFLALMRSVTFCIIDEAHHATLKNSYGILRFDTERTVKGVKRVYECVLPNVRKILGLTGSPDRTDGEGLGVDEGGIFDVLVEGTPQQELMELGRISRWDVVLSSHAAAEALDAANIPRSVKRDLSLNKQGDVLAGTAIVGDIIETYKRKGRGLPGAIFLPTLEMSTETAERFNAAGIKAVHLDGGTDPEPRAKALEDFKAREIQILCNVGLFGEGVNIPALKYVAIAFRTVSVIKWLQFWGRILRAGERGILADHCDNWKIHGPPTLRRTWSLKRKVREKDAEAVKYCMNPECPSGQQYEAWRDSCPACGWGPAIECGRGEDCPADNDHKLFPKHLRMCPAPGCGWEIPVNPKDGPEQVDGDLTLLSCEMLTELREPMTALRRSEEEFREAFVEKWGVGNKNEVFNVARFRKNKAASEQLEHKIQEWYVAEKGGLSLSTAECHKWFWQKFSLTIPEALGKKTTEINKLIERFENETNMADPDGSR